MGTIAKKVALVLCFCVALPGLAQAQTEAPAELHVGGMLGAPYSGLVAEGTDGWAGSARVELRLYAPSGIGGVLRPFAQLGTPNLFGGEAGIAHQWSVGLRDGLELVGGGAVGVSIAERMYFGGFSLGSISGTGPDQQDHTVFGYFVELHAELRFRSGFYVGVAAVHHGYVLDTLEQSSSPMFSIAPAIRVGRAFDL